MDKVIGSARFIDSMESVNTEMGGSFSGKDKGSGKVVTSVQFGGIVPPVHTRLYSSPNIPGNLHSAIFVHSRSKSNISCNKKWQQKNVGS